MYEEGHMDYGVEGMYGEEEDPYYNEAYGQELMDH